MNRRYYYFRIVVIILLFLLVCRIFYLDFAEKNSINIDDFLAVVLLLFGLRLVITRSRGGQYLVLFFILVSVCKLINWNINLSSNSYTSSSSLAVGGLSANAFGLLLLLIYCLINWDGLKVGFSRLRYGSGQEQKDEEDKMVSFYYNKFYDCTPSELEEAFSMFDSYPVEAQIALNKIRAEKAV